MDNPDIEAVQSVPLALVTGEIVHDNTKDDGSGLESAAHHDIGDGWRVTFENEFFTWTRRCGSDRYLNS